MNDSKSILKSCPEVGLLIMINRPNLAHTTFPIRKKRKKEKKILHGSYNFGTKSKSSTLNGDTPTGTAGLEVGQCGSYPVSILPLVIGD